jgi:hypothetical protein
LHGCVPVAASNLALSSTMGKTANQTLDREKRRRTKRDGQPSSKSQRNNKRNRCY